MFLALAFLAYVVAVPVGYEQAAAEIPAEHWALIEEIRVRPDYTHGSTSRSRPRITLPTWRPGRDGTLKHEVGHVVFNTTPGLLEEFERRFWPGGKPRGRPCLSPTYPTRTYREDAAECYEAYIDNKGNLGDKERERFMRERVFRNVQVR